MWRAMLVAGENAQKLLIGEDEHGAVVTSQTFVSTLNQCQTLNFVFDQLGLNPFLIPPGPTQIISFSYKNIFIKLTLF